MRRMTSRQIAALRGVGTVSILTRDVATVDMNLDLATATGDQLEEQRAAILRAIDQGATAELIERAQAVAAAVTAYNGRVSQADAARAALLGGQVARTSSATPDRVDDEQRSEPERHVRIGRAFTSSPHFRAYDGHGNVRVTIPGEVRALFATTNYPSQATRVPGVLVPNRDTPLTILDLIDRQSIDTSTVEWVQETGYPNSAAAVAEGGVKPESTFGFELKQDTARTIAHWVKFTRQVLQDESQVQGYIEGRLTYGLLRKVNEQILSGDGVAPNLRGILNTSGIGTYTAAAGEEPLVSVRRARTVAELSEYAPDTVVMNPVDWERIELSTDANGAFLAIANVAQGATPRVWGLNVVQSTGLTASAPDPDGAGAGVAVGGKFLVGAFREGATLWERTGVELYMTDSHASDFTSNLITLLAELRAVLSVWRPKAFVSGTFAAPA